MTTTTAMTTPAMPRRRTDARHAARPLRGHFVQNQEALPAPAARHVPAALEKAHELVKLEPQRLVEGILYPARAQVRHDDQQTASVV